MKGGRIGHVRPKHLLLILEKNGGTRVLEEYVVAGIPLVQLVPYLAVQVIVGILGLPQAARHAQRVPDRSVGLVAAVRPQLWYENQSF